LFLIAVAIDDVETSIAQQRSVQSLQAMDSSVDDDIGQESIDLFFSRPTTLPVRSIAKEVVF
jgi:hypothetical protein